MTNQPQNKDTSYSIVVEHSPGTILTDNLEHAINRYIDTSNMFPQDNVCLYQDLLTPGETLLASNHDKPITWVP